MRVNKADLTRCAELPGTRLHCMTYGLSDGMPTLECSGGFQPSACWTADGRLWFPTSQGVVAVDPSHVATNTLVPPVVIERLVVDDRVVWENASSTPRLQIAPGRHRFEFQFAGLSFVAPEMVRFRYRLEGAETEWVETAVAAKGLLRASRAGRLPIPGPGLQQRRRVEYRGGHAGFQRLAGVLADVVVPRFRRRSARRLPAGGIVWLNSRRSMRRKLERLERQQAVERERMRIAKDLHDDLGASLTRIAMLSESARSAPRESRQVPVDLDQIHHTARELIRAMGEVVWAVNPRHDTLEGLAAYLEESGQHLLRTAGIRCKLDIPLRLPAWTLTAEVRHNVFLAFKEALHNAVKHAGDSEVRISLTLQPAAFTLSVEDNGPGFVLDPFAPEPTPERAGHPAGNGLLNMRQRIAEIGGRSEITSHPGVGTRVTFIVPVDPALMTQHDRNSLGTTVSIVEDDVPVRQILAKWIDTAKGFRCLSAFGDAEKALAQLPGEQPNVLLMDINLPGLSGIECVRRLKPQLPDTQFLMLTVYADMEHIFDALSAGASGYLLKETGREELIASLKLLHDGGAPMTSHIARKLVQSFHQPQPEKQDPHGLTPREQTILGMLASGDYYKEIADSLGISVHTVCTHIRRVYEKLHVRSRAQAVAKYTHSAHRQNPGQPAAHQQG